jgi:hypothetical protein
MGISQGTLQEHNPPEPREQRGDKGCLTTNSVMTAGALEGEGGLPWDVVPVA